MNNDCICTGTGTSSLFIGVGATGKIYTSTNITSGFTDRTTGANTMNSIAYSPDTNTVLIATSGSIAECSGVNTANPVAGQQWLTPAQGNFLAQYSSNNWLGIAYGNGVFVLTATNNTIALMS